MAATSVSARFQELFPETNLISLLTKYGGDADDIFETIQDRYDAHEQEPLVGLLASKPRISTPLPAPPTGISSATSASGISLPFPAAKPPPSPPQPQPTAHHASRK